MKGICRWCHHHRNQHNGVSHSKRLLHLNIRWLKSACSVADCMCRKFEA